MVVAQGPGLVIRASMNLEGLDKAFYGAGNLLWEIILGLVSYGA